MNPVPASTKQRSSPQKHQAAQMPQAQKAASTNRLGAGRSLTVAARNSTPDRTCSAKPGPLPAVSGVRAYFLTFTCYGTWLHGDQGGSVDPQHNVFGTFVMWPNPVRIQSERARMDEPAYELDAARRKIVLEAIREVCAGRGWWLHVAHVRTAHIHVIVQAGDPPEKVMNDLKSYSSSALNRGGIDQQRLKRWTRHGSTRYLWNQKQLDDARDYVIRRQGAPMALYVAPTYGPGTEPRP